MAAAAITTSSRATSGTVAARPEGMAGLDVIEVVLRDAADLDAIATRAESVGIPITKEGNGMRLRDPWGTAVALTH